ncbi:hypothetical protein ACHAXA_001058 [Cyclostephanos tholiformis]|uniref:K Homology domain-containing protein n=1 Tax=Cyclostephanos tholiformis TaxID=382380 RepID=A0ABD3R1N9_9STRA
MPGRYHPSGTNTRHGAGNVDPRSHPQGGSVVRGVNPPPSSSSTTGPNGVDGVVPVGLPPPPPPLAAESQSLARMRQMAVNHPTQQVRLTMYVPPRTVGAVIGRGGRTVLSVQREATRRSGGHVGPVRVSVLGAGGSSPPPGIGVVGHQYADDRRRKKDGPRGVDVADGDDDDDEDEGGGGDYGEDDGEYDGDDVEDVGGNDEWTPVIIRGDPVGAFAAARQILILVENEHDPHIVLDVPLHVSRHNLLIGRGGIVIAALSATYQTRIMIPPNEFMNDVVNGVDGGGSGGVGSDADGEGGSGGDKTGNVWEQRQRQRQLLLQQQAQRRTDVGSSMLFGGDVPGGVAASAAAMGPNARGSATSSSSSSLSSSSSMQQQSQGSGALPPNVVQLEGGIDNVERCLVKIFGIVTGETWAPTGIIVERNSSLDGGSGGRKEGATTKATPTTTKAATLKSAVTATTKTIVSATPSTGKPPSSATTTKKETPATTAEAVIVKVWTPTSKILNLGKIRKVQRKTNTIIRRKKLRLVGSGGSNANISNLVNEKDEDVMDDNETSDNDEEEGLKESPFDGKTESVKQAASEFEKILGLDPGSSVITDTTNKGNSNRKPTADSVSSRDGIILGEGANVNQGDINPDVESAEVGGGCVEPGSKRIPRRKKKRGKGGGNEQPKGSKEERSRTPAVPNRAMTES